MKHLLTLRDQDFDPSAPYVDSSGYYYRKTARAVVYNGRKVALLYVTKKHYYKLPGGGIDPEETTIEALHREVLEEIGCHITDVHELGETLEYMDQRQMYQRSFCFSARVIGEAGPPAFTDKELADGFEIVWADDLANAMQLIRDAQPNSLSGPFIQRRDLAILQAAEAENQA